MSMLPDRGVVSWSGGIEASVVCVDTATLAAGFCGAPCDTACLRRLPEGVCPCGEDGEFHTFVHAGPIFACPIEIEVGETVERDGFVFTDLLPSERGGR